MNAGPEAVFSDWMLDFLYLVVAFVVSVLPGIGLYHLLLGTPVPNWWTVPASLFFLFPVVLLSLQAANSPFMPLSPAVWGSLFSTWWAWAIFYFETGVMAAAFLALSELFVGLLGGWGLILSVMLWVPLSMIYFRLLGRVAWCCNPTMEPVEEIKTVRPDTRPPLLPESPLPAASPAAAPPPPAPPPVVDSAPPSRQASPEPPPPAEAPPKPPPAEKRAPSILDDDFDLS